MQFASDFDKERRAIKLGLHRERLMTTHREIDNSTPRCYKEYQVQRLKNKQHRQREKQLDEKRRRRFSMMSPYSKHLKRSQSENTIGRQSLNFELDSNHQIELNSLSLTASLSPVNIHKSQTANSSMLDSMASTSQSSHHLKRRGNVHRSKKTVSTLRRKQSAKLARKQRELEAENEKLRTRLSTVKSSTYIDSIQKHWSLHGNIRRNRRISNQKKQSKYPDIIHTANYKKLQKQQTTEKEQKMMRFSGLRSGRGSN